MAVPRPAAELLEGRTLLAAAGDLDVSFSGDGRALFPLAGASVNDVAVQADGKLLLFGQVADAAGHTALLLARLLSDGTPDSSFGPAGAAGTVRLDLGGDDTAAEVTTRPDGRIILAASVATASSTSVAVLRLLADGTPDAGFGVA